MFLSILNSIKGYVCVCVCVCVYDVCVYHPISSKRLLTKLRGPWVAQFVGPLPWAQVTILGWRPAAGSLLRGRSASPSPSASPPACAHTLSLSYARVCALSVSVK